jgi:hypothetical protein
MSNGTRVLVYGDDIICSAEIADQVVQALAFVGFQTNRSKSFLSGNFFESCGKHYFGGIDVTPVYQKEDSEAGSEKIRRGNRLLRIAVRYGSGYNPSPKVLPAWRTAWRRGGHSRRFQLPFGVSGDDGWVLPATEFAPRPQDINLGIRCLVQVPIKVRLPADDNALLAWTMRRGVVTPAPYQGQVTSSPATTLSDDHLTGGHRWVMPSGEFDIES